MKTIAIFSHHPECSDDCIDGMTQALGNEYIIKNFNEYDCNAETFKNVDMIAFPGGIGEAAAYDTFFRRKSQQVIADYVAGGGRYLGICMGAYWAGSYYFDILDGIDAVQYIKQPNADIRRSYGTVANVLWDGKQQNIFFYDGCAIVGDLSNTEVVATYKNGDAAAVIQGRVGIIGPHPESLKYWYEEPYQYLNSHWHNGSHHELLLNFVNRLMNSN